MAIKVKVYNQKAELVGEENLSEKIFCKKVNEDLVHQAMVTQTSNMRQVLAHTKDRSEVRGGGKKPWRQKGTGRARAGSSRSPLWRGGGVTFGPTKDRNFKMEINKKMKQNALCMVLSDKLSSNQILVLDKLSLSEFKTKTVNEILEVLETKVLAIANDKKKTKRSILVINDQKDEKVKFSTRNLAGVKIINLENINILDLLKYKSIILTQVGVKKIEEQYK
jgi:large subunit ribosomal protein L4